MLEAMEPMEAARQARIEQMAAEMRADMDASGRKQRLYRVDVHVDGGSEVQRYNQQVIKAVAGAVAYNVEHDRREKVDLFDVEDTRQRISEYCAACSLCGFLPGMSGLAGYGFKCSRAWISKFMRDNPRHQTTELLNTVRELFADALLNTGLMGAANPAMSIFALKNTANYRDKPEGDDTTEAEDDYEYKSVEDVKKWLANTAAVYGFDADEIQVEGQEQAQ